MRSPSSRARTIDIAMDVLDALGITAIAIGAAAAALLSVALGSWLRTVRDPTTFRCRVGHFRRHHWRRVDDVRWSRFRTRARWVGDVLLVQVGVLRMRTSATRVVLPPGARITRESAEVVRRLGPRPESLWLETDDGPAFGLAVSRPDRMMLVGPYLAAAIPGLPLAPREDRRSGR